MTPPTAPDDLGGWNVLAAVATGGALGTVARWSLSTALGATGDGWPWATFTVNLIGSFVLGVLVVLQPGRWADWPLARPFLAVGVLGGFTTFSTYAVEGRHLIAEGAPALAAAYLGVSVLAALLALTLGGWVARRLVPS